MNNIAYYYEIYGFGFKLLLCFFTFQIRKYGEKHEKC